MYRGNSSSYILTVLAFKRLYLLVIFFEFHLNYFAYTFPNILHNSPFLMTSCLLFNRLLNKRQSLFLDFFKKKKRSKQIWHWQYLIQHSNSEHCNGFFSRKTESLLFANFENKWSLGISLGRRFNLKFWVFWNIEN